MHECIQKDDYASSLSNEMLISPIPPIGSSPTLLLICFSLEQKLADFKFVAQLTQRRLLKYILLESFQDLRMR